MTVSSVGSDRIQLRWTPTGDESAWIVGYKADGDVDWTEFNTTSTTYTFTGLNASTHYLLRVGTECDGDTLFANGDATTLAGNPGDPSCPVPSDLTATADTDRVTLSWTPQGDENLWQVRLYNSDFDSLYICSASSGVLIDDLDVDAGYDVTVRAVCGDGDTSDWSAAVFFTTGMADPGCVAPTGITVAAVTDSSVVASWTPESGERRWQVHIYNAGFDSVYRAYSSYVAMGGLRPRSSYNIAVRAVCGDGDTSDWSAVVAFSTRNVGVDKSVDGVSVLVRPNPAIHAAQVDISGVNGTVMLSVVDPGGRVVHTDRMECADTCVKTFYVDGLSRGAWFIRIASDTFAVVRKLIVQ
ncbi:MAG: fibronectin type III domain-containing protein [bacterium P3]|nr:MAG: fibronectin type III domain-containing protein [bacterium P3]KWW41033.1 MAG: fibronectin type III domain-containing protein [bacterium F083]